MTRLVTHMNLFRLFGAVRRAKRMVDNYPEKFARYNRYFTTRGYPPLVTETAGGRYEFNTNYRLHSWGYVFPSNVQFQATFFPPDNGKPVQFGKQFLFPVSDII